MRGRIRALGVSLVAAMVALCLRPKSRVVVVEPAPESPGIPTEAPLLSAEDQLLLSVYSKNREASSAAWQSMYQVVFFVLTAAGALASVTVLVLTRDNLQPGDYFAYLTYAVMTGLWGALTLFGGIYWLMSFAAMLRAGTAARHIECDWLRRHSDLRSHLLWEHRLDSSRLGPTVVGYAMSACVAITAAIGAQCYAHYAWGPGIDAPEWLISAGWLFTALQLVVLLSYATWTVVAFWPSCLEVCPSKAPTRLAGAANKGIEQNARR